MVTDRAHAGHVCCFFSTDDQQAALVGSFLAEGLAADQRLVYLSDGTTAAAVARSLDAHGHDGGALLRDGRLVVASTEDSYLADGRFDGPRVIDALRTRIDDALADGYAGVRVTGEMGWATRGAPGSEGLAAYERDVNALFGDGTLDALCQYDRRVFGAGEAEPVVRHHDVCASGAFVATRNAGGVHFAGELDFDDVDVLAACLRAAADHDGDVEVDLADAEFLDLAAVRVLVGTARSMPAGAALRLRNAKRSVERVLSVTGWADTPQLVVA